MKMRVMSFIMLFVGALGMRRTVDTDGQIGAELDQGAVLKQLSDYNTILLDQVKSLEQELLVHERSVQHDQIIEHEAAWVEIADKHTQTKQKVNESIALGTACSSQKDCKGVKGKDTCSFTKRGGGTCIDATSMWHRFWRTKGYYKESMCKFKSKSPYTKNKATCSTKGKYYNKKVKGGRSEASVHVTAELTDMTHVVRYWIKWEANVVPAGSHMNQQPNTASVSAHDGFVMDMSPAGTGYKSVPIGMRAMPKEAMTDHHYRMPTPKAMAKGDWWDYPRDECGFYWHFEDNMQQPGKLQGGKWWFKLDVVDKHGHVKATSAECEVDWDRMD